MNNTERKCRQYLKAIITLQITLRNIRGDFLRGFLQGGGVSEARHTGLRGGCSERIRSATKKRGEVVARAQGSHGIDRANRNFGERHTMTKQGHTKQA